MYLQGTTAHFSSVAKPLPPESPDVLDRQVVSQEYDLDELSCYVNHQIYQCPIYVWASKARYQLKSKGRRLSRECFIVYMEYRASDKASCYHQKAFEGIEAARRFVESRAAVTQLPGICAKMTKRYGISSGLMNSR